MPLRDALNLGSGRTSDSDTRPISEELIDNITKILADSQSDPDSYDVGAVFTGIVYAIGLLESRNNHLNEVCAHQIGTIAMLEKRIVALEA